MNWPYELQIGWRYTRAGRGGRRNRFISFISGVSMFGIALGVAALIIVLSVMNGFQKEVRDRMLSVIAHVELLNDSGDGLPDWRAVADIARQNPEVLGAAPFVSGQALIARGSDMRGTIVRGIDPALEPGVTPIAAELAKDGLLHRLQAGQWNVILGVELARQLGVQTGDKITLAIPSGQVTPLGVQPTLRQFTLVGIFKAGHYEYDSGLALIHVGDAAKVFRTGTPSGVQLKLRDAQRAPAVTYELQRAMLQARQSIFVRDWTSTNKNWYDAVRVEKRMMGIILTLIVAVAAFNLVSTLVMTVTDKQADIAILRTLGAQPALDHGRLHDPGRAGRRDGHARRTGPGTGRGAQPRRHRPVHREDAAHHLPARQHLRHQPHAQRPAMGRHRADHGDLADPGLRRDALSELARQPRATGGGAAL